MDIDLTWIAKDKWPFQHLQIRSGNLWPLVSVKFSITLPLTVALFAIIHLNIISYLEAYCNDNMICMDIGWFNTQSSVLIGMFYAFCHLKFMDKHGLPDPDGSWHSHVLLRPIRLLDSHEHMAGTSSTNQIARFSRTHGSAWVRELTITHLKLQDFQAEPWQHVLIYDLTCTNNGMHRLKLLT